MSLFDKLNATINTPSTPKAVAQRGNITHPNSDHIVERATQIMLRSYTGQKLMDFANDAQLQMVVLANRAESGYAPEGKTIYLNVPAAQDIGSAAIIIQLTAALREAMQEEIDELKRPSFEWTKQQFSQRHVDRGRDKRFYICAVAHELVYEHNMRELFDEMAKIGYDVLLEAYGKDLQESKNAASGEEM